MWHMLSTKEVEKKNKTNSMHGLNAKQVQERIQKYGANKLEEQKKESIIIRFLKQFNDFMIIILIIASIISAVVAKIEGSGDYFDSIIIIAIVIFNAIMGLVQEAKAEKSLEALKKMSAPTCKVRREGKVVTIKGEDVVPGDIVLLEAGCFVPADGRLISSSNLKIEESSLTGETVPVSKEADAILPEKTVLGDMVNMVFATTIVVNGHGEVIVTETGMNTKVGKIAKMILTNEAPQTPIQKKLAQVGKTLGIACLAICILIFIIGLIKKIEPIEMFMTSVGLAVAAIPEGLPAIVTIMLSIGVTKMAKKNSIIRKLPAVETLGSSSVICSDKTGTLTQNKMQVTKMVNAEGEISDKSLSRWLLQLATMCTDVEVYKIGGKLEVNGEATEVAIVNKALQEGEDKQELYQAMKRIADIPFDSSRKMMSTIHQTARGYRIICKGAPDVLLKRCKQIYHHGKVTTLTQNLISNLESQNLKMAEQALRVLAVAYLDVDRLPSNIESKTIEQNLIFVGLVGMIDPPREGVKEAVETCQRAGIKTVMITGDHIATARAIAKELGILRKNDLSITRRRIRCYTRRGIKKKYYEVFSFC